MDNMTLNYGGHLKVFKIFKFLIKVFVNDLF